MLLGRGVDFQSPPQPELAVARGATAFQNDPSVIHARKADATYGIALIFSLMIPTNTVTVQVGSTMIVRQENISVKIYSNLSFSRQIVYVTMKYLLANFLPQVNQVIQLVSEFSPQQKQMRSMLICLELMNWVQFLSNWMDTDSIDLSMWFST